MATAERPVGSRSVTGKRSHGLGWLPWVALLVLLALVALAVLVVTNVNDENDDPGLDVTDDEVVDDSAPAIDSPVLVAAPPLSNV
jgi:hypothetical protein